MIYGDLVFCRATGGIIIQILSDDALNSEQRVSRLRNYVRATRRYRSQHEIKSFDMFSPFNHPRTWRDGAWSDLAVGAPRETHRRAMQVLRSVFLVFFAHSTDKNSMFPHTGSESGESEREGERRARRSHKE